MDMMLVGLNHEASAGLVESLSAGERAEVYEILSAVSRKIIARPAAIGVTRVRLEMVVALLIDAMDALDGDTDLEDGHDAEPVCEDEGAQCDDEGSACDLEPGEVGA